MRITRIFFGLLAVTSFLFIILCVSFFSYKEREKLLNVKTEALLTIRVDELQHDIKDDIDSSHQSNNISLKHRACNGTIFPSQFAYKEDWYPFDEKRSIYVFSAYMIRSKNKLLIIGAKVRSLKVVAFCQMWKWDSSNNTILMKTSKAHSTMPQEGQGRKYTSTIMECPLVPSFIPTHVSLSENACGTPRNLMKVNDASAPEVYNYNFTVCLSPLYYEFDDSRKLIEWIELNRLLGADRFIIYNHSVSSNIDHVLGYYSKRGLVNTIKWRPPMRVNTKPKTNNPVEIHYFGQTAALNDCLYRSRSTSKFLVNTDLDEFIIPHAENVSDWWKLLHKIEMPNTVTYMFRSTYFRMEWINTEVEVPESELVQKFNLITLQKFGHETKIFRPNQRSKYIVRTSGADMIFVHEVPRAVRVVAPIEVGLVHHYRFWGKLEENKQLITDDTVKQKFGPNLIKNVRNVWKDLANQQINVFN